MSFHSDEKFWDRQPVGKQGLAGRPIEDIQAYEFFQRGLSEFSFRLLSEGRYQVSASEAVFTTQFLKRTRELDLDIDEVARTCFTDEIPDNHRDATKFMQKLSSDSVEHMKAKLPGKPSTDESEALAKAKAKLAAHGLALTPDNRDAQSSARIRIPSLPKRAKFFARRKRLISILKTGFNN